MPECASCRKGVAELVWCAVCGRGLCQACYGHAAQSKCKDCLCRAKIRKVLVTAGAVIIVASVAAAAIVALINSESYTGSRRPTSVLDLGGGTTMEVVLIPAGEFMMGSSPYEKGRNDFKDEMPYHVVMAKPFYIGKYEVTQEQYAAVMGEYPSYPKGRTNPVSGVTWEKAKEFCAALSAQTGLIVRLPWEEEWEYACRAGTTTAYFFGESSGELGEFAWYGGNCREGQPVGQKRPNQWGLYDIYGNVKEWCGDTGDAIINNAPYLRGGDYCSPAADCRSGHGDWQFYNETAGFRIVVQVSPNDGVRPADARIVPVKIGRWVVEAEVADTPELRRTGLRGRAALEPGYGMLFVFEKPDYVYFWMKDTTIPLSIAFIEEDGTIDGIKDMQPQDLTRVCSREHVKYALEVPQGWFEQCGVKAGMKAEVVLDKVEASRRKTAYEDLMRQAQAAMEKAKGTEDAKLWGEAAALAEKAVGTGHTYVSAARGVLEEATRLQKQFTYNDLLRQAQAALEKAKGTDDAELWGEVKLLAEKAVATGHADVSVARGILAQVLVPDWAKVSQEQVAAARKASVAAAQEVDLGGGVKMKLVLIPAGEFTMGSAQDERNAATQAWEQCRVEEKAARRLADAEGPQHRVKITKPFYMGIYEVTQEQYEAVMGTNPSKFRSAKNPVEHVSWDDAQEFCKKLSAKAGMTVRLPTEAEWEYACRAGTTTRFSFGDNDAQLFRYANYADMNTLRDIGAVPWADGAHDDGFADTAPVGSFNPNPWGLYDMHGNLAEWCQDWFDAAYYGNYPAADPQGPANGTYRVLRGGSWGFNPNALRSANRNCNLPARAGSGLGFRVVVASQ